MDRTASQRAGLAQGAPMAEWIFLLADSIGCAVLAWRRPHGQGQARGPGLGLLLLSPGLGPAPAGRRQRRAASAVEPAADPGGRPAGRTSRADLGVRLRGR